MISNTQIPMDRDTWRAWQDSFVNSLQIQSKDNKYSFNILNDQILKEFPRSQRVYVTGMKRSGNHAIINWMIKNCFESQVFINNAVRPVPDLVEVFRAGGLKPGLIDRVICSFEQISLDFFSNNKVWYIVRDPYNWIASWINHPHFNLNLVQKDIDTYIENIEKSKNIILYNEWFKDQNYRNQLAYQLGFTNRDLGLDDVSRYGGGSSFDSYEFEGRGRSMDVLNRWKNEIENEAYIEIVDKNKEKFKKVLDDLFKMRCPID